MRTKTSKDIELERRELRSIVLLQKITIKYTQYSRAEGELSDSYFTVLHTVTLSPIVEINCSHMHYSEMLMYLRELVYVHLRGDDTPLQ